MALSPSALGWLTFAGAMLMLVGAFNIVVGLVALARSDVFVAAGGVPFPYTSLVAHLPTDRPVWAVQGRELADPDFVPGTLDDVVGDHLAVLRSVVPDGPYDLVGWSFGGVVAHALAARLAAAG